MTAHEEEWWLANTPAGQVYQYRGLPTHRTLDAIDRDVDRTNLEYRSRFGRDLTAEERDTLRIGAARCRTAMLASSPFRTA